MHSEDEVVANVMEILSKVASDAGLLPGKFTNIKAVYLKTHDSVALPVYAAPSLTSEEERLIDDDAHKGAKAKKMLGMKKKEKLTSVKSLLVDAPDACTGQKGKMTPSKTDSQKKRKKKRDDDVEEEEREEEAGIPKEDDDADAEDVPVKKTKKKQKRAMDDEKPNTTKTGSDQKKKKVTTKRKLRAE